MARQMRLLIILIVVLTFAALAPCRAGDETEFAGSYVWEREDKTEEGSLEVTIEPAEDGKFNVEFRFDWEGEPRLFAGRAWGSLSGDLAGKVDSDDPGHPLKFHFEGTFSDGAFSGTHGYYNGLGKLVPSGTMKMSVPTKS